MKGIPVNKIPAYPLITVVTAVFNGAGLLDTTIQSVLDQTYGNVEYIVIDGGSMDGTLDVIRKHEGGIDFWLSECDNGVYDAFNKASPFIHGEWTIFLGAGDILHDHGVLARVASVVQHLKSETEIVYGRVAITNDDGSTVKTLNRSWDLMKDKWRGGRPMLPHHQGIFHRKSLLKTESPFNTKYRIAADSALVYSSIQRERPVFLDFNVACAPIGGVSTNPRYFISTAHEILSINRSFGYRNYAHQLWFYLKSLTKSLVYLVAGTNATKKLIDEYRVVTGRKRKWTI